MIFATMPCDQAVGAVLVHSIRAGDRMLKKGRVLTREDTLALIAAGVQQVVAARMEAGDIGENECADRLSNACLGLHMERSVAATGRVNLFAGTHGVLVLDKARIDALNGVDEAITLATLPAFSVVQPKEMVATIKIIPYAVDNRLLAVAEAMARQGGPPLSVQPIKPKKVGLVLSQLPGVKDSVIEGTIAATRERVEALGGGLVATERCAHEESEIAARIARLRAAGAEIVLVSGASAVADRRDVAPAAIVRAGGVIEHFGMPVDPGNLLLLGRIDATPALVLPGCARSPKLNGFDWVLTRLFADIPVASRDIMDMGVGGLLKEIDVRPLPRAKAPEHKGSGPAPKRGPRIAALVLAAGRSRRMAPLNKLLVADASGRPMITRVVDNVLASRARPVIVVTGHEAPRVRDVLHGRDVMFVHAERYADGLSASLRAGVEALPPDVDGVIVCLGDMPLVSGEMLDRLMSAFDPEEGRGIIMPTFRGKQGNPMLWGRAYFDEMRKVSGDVGARHLVGLHTEVVHEVEMSDDAVLRDFDTTEALTDLPNGLVRGRPIGK
ncbi:MAG: molybdopterin-binding/glycosyltransferase family 2 protein [Alphaproteobacteria bacterium]|nr:molybdopterin-binding/glycosyltransferase family 2 protein [Alphaproteobacteria bacterium]